MFELSTTVDIESQIQEEITAVYLEIFDLNDYEKIKKYDKKNGKSGIRTFHFDNCYKNSLVGVYI